MTKTPIEPGDIRKGDLIRAEYTIDGEPEAHEHVANCDGDIWGRVGGTTHFRLDRPKPPVVLPTEAGAYRGTYGDGEQGSLYVLDTAGIWHDFSLCHSEMRTWTPTNYMPFTKLEPVAQIAEQALLLAVAAIESSGTGTATYKSTHAKAVKHAFRNQFGLTP